MKVPFVDLAAGIAPLKERFLAAMGEILDSTQFISGEAVARFESEFAIAAGARHAVAVKNGTDALMLMLKASGIGPGDEVILPTNSFFATAEAVCHVGATPIFADVRADTLLIDVEDVERRLGPRTRAVIAVHLYGQMAAMESLRELCQLHSLALFEDAAQAHGASRRQCKAGSFGDAAAFSFYPTKNLGAFGEGGAVTTSSDALADKLRRLRDHGQMSKNQHAEVGFNARLDSIQCACLSIRLAELDQKNAARRQLAARYQSALAGVFGIELLAIDDAGLPVHHLFVVRVTDGRRSILQNALGHAGVASAIHYPTPIHLQPAFAGRVGLAPVAEKAATEILSLPMYPELPNAAVDYVVAVIKSAL